MNARSLWALEKHKGKWIRRLFFCVFSLHWRPRFYCHAASPEPPRRVLSKKCKQSSETPRFLSPLQGSHGLAGMQAVGLVRLSYVPHSKNGWALHENWLSNWKWKVMLKCTIMNGCFCRSLTSCLVFCWHLQIFLWDLKMLHDGFQHHVGGLLRVRRAVSLHYCYINPRYYIAMPT